MSEIDKQAGFKENFAKHAIPAMKDYGKKTLKSTGKGAIVGGVTAGALIGNSSYNTKKNELSNPKYMKEKNKNIAERIDDLDKSIERAKTPNAFDMLSKKDFQESYSPAMLAREDYTFDNEGSSWYHDALENKLSDNGIDYKNIPWSQYKKTISDNRDAIAIGDSFDLPESLKSKKAAVEIVNETFEKQAGMISGGIGFVGGGVAGGILGDKIGNGLAKAKFKPSKEQQKLLSENENLRKIRKEKDYKYSDLLNQMPQISDEDFDNLRTELNHPKFDNYTVGQIEDYVSNRYNKEVLNKMSAQTIVADTFEKIAALTSPGPKVKSTNISPEMMNKIPKLTAPTPPPASGISKGLGALSGATKGVAKAVGSVVKKHPLIAGGIAAAGVGSYLGAKAMNKTACDIVNETFEKQAKIVSRDNDTSTQYMRDRYTPNMKRGLQSMSLALPGFALTGAGMAKGNFKMIGAGAPLFLAGGLAGRHMGLKLMNNTLDELSKKYDVQPTEQDREMMNSVYRSGGNTSMVTPESIVQRLRREKDRRSAFEKQAGAKDIAKRFAKTISGKNVTEEKYKMIRALNPEIFADMPSRLSTSTKALIATNPKVYRLDGPNIQKAINERDGLRKFVAINTAPLIATGVGTGAAVHFGKDKKE